MVVDGAGEVGGGASGEAAGGAAGGPAFCRRRRRILSRCTTCGDPFRCRGLPRDRRTAADAAAALAGTADVAKLDCAAGRHHVPMSRQPALAACLGVRYGLRRRPMAGVAVPRAVKRSAKMQIKYGGPLCKTRIASTGI